MKSVVSAIIIRQGHGGEKHLLLTMRDNRSDFANHWETPGGKVEQGEFLTDAIRRELAEELGVHSIIMRRPVCTIVLDRPGAESLEMTFFLVDISPDDEPRPLQSRCLAYFEAEALHDLPMTPGTTQVVPHIFHLMKGAPLPGSLDLANAKRNDSVVPPEWT